MIDAIATLEVVATGRGRRLLQNGNNRSGIARNVMSSLRPDWQFNDKERKPMKPSTRDEVKGTLHEMKGKVKEKAGQVTNNRRLETKGKAENTAGKVQKKAGQIEKVLER
jgi:uncharacterized protein YjbJ (UPF0337 family)